MPRGRARSCNSPSAPFEISKETSNQQELDFHLQRQLQEDIARIFDETICADLEVVFAKSKILTHTCILKTRAEKFYNILQKILQININKHLYEEIYSFVSDVYTECDVKKQEKEILQCLEDYMNTLKNIQPTNSTLKDNNCNEESEIFLTPNDLSPQNHNNKNISLKSSPKLGVTKEYYALVPFDNISLDKEIQEQEELSNAFKTFLKNQTVVSKKSKESPVSKPTSLSIKSSHNPNKKHSDLCDYLLNENSVSFTNELPDSNNWAESVASDPEQAIIKTDTAAESVYSPDSLITDDLSSSSDYLSAVYTCLQGDCMNICVHQSSNNIKMDNVTTSDSGLQNTGANTQKDQSEASITETILNELHNDDVHNLQCSDTNCDQIQVAKSNSPDELHVPTEIHVKKETSTVRKQQQLSNDVASCDSKYQSSKEEKQRQNEEIVTLESSSLSTETGSWESAWVTCTLFLDSERLNSISNTTLPKESTDTKNIKSFTVTKSPIKKASCFIDAANLVDECEVSHIHECPKYQQSSSCREPFKVHNPSLLEWSGNDYNDVTFRQDNTNKTNEKLSPTIFALSPEGNYDEMFSLNAVDKNEIVISPLQSYTPHNSIDIRQKEIHEKISNNKSGSRISTSKLDKVEPLMKTFLQNKTTLTQNGDRLVSNIESLSDPKYNNIPFVGDLMQSQQQVQNTTNDFEEQTNSFEGYKANYKHKKFSEFSPIISGGASIKDHLPCSSSNNLLLRKKLDATPIITGVLLSDNSSKNTAKHITTPAWVVDMSKASGCDKKTDQTEKRDDCIDKMLKSSKIEASNCSYQHSQHQKRKSHSSVDSDGSDKSSHKFYVDLASLPDPLSDHEVVNFEKSHEKKNIFSMYIDVSDNTKVKNMPTRLGSSLHTKKNLKEKPKEHSLSVKTVHTKNGTSAPLKCNKKLSEASSDLFEFANTEELNLLTSIKVSGNLNNHDASEDCHLFDTEEINDKSELERVKETKPIVLNIEPSYNENETSGLVKLSDLDKTLVPLQETDYDETLVDIRMARSAEFFRSCYSENELTLNRLFPHLKDEFSRSMPLSLENRSRSPLRIAHNYAASAEFDFSEGSSGQSSYCRTNFENSTTVSTASSNLIVNCQSRLGQDLLRMFLERIATDVTVEVNGRRIKAHKCILSSRCQYFAGILSGGWVESAGDVITMTSYSYATVHFALCYIYSGVSIIPELVSIAELAALADMLGLEGLKEVIMFTIKVKYCHQFHRPCAVCVAGVFEFFPLTSAYGLDYLYRKCLRWITKYFHMVWATRHFATLPRDLIEKCYQQQILNMSTDNLVDTVCGCGTIVSALPSTRWAETVVRLCRRVINAAGHFTAPRLFDVVSEILTSPPDTSRSAVRALNECITIAIQASPFTEARRTHELLANYIISTPDLLTGSHSSKIVGQCSWLMSYVINWKSQCDTTLRHQFPAVTADKRNQSPFKHPKSSKCQEHTISNRITYSNRHVKPKFPGDTKNVDMERVRVAFKPYAMRPITTPESDIKREKTTNSCGKLNQINPPVIRTTKTQESRMKLNRSVAGSTHLHDISNKPIANVSKFGNTKPRYLEPRARTVEPEKKAPLTNAKKYMVSSSDSSRNTSPITNLKHIRVSRVTTRQKNSQLDQENLETTPSKAMSQDSLATTSRPRTAEPSTDSLTESQTSNKYGTYTKVKHGKTNTNVKSVASPKNNRMGGSLSCAQSRIPILRHTETKAVNKHIEQKNRPAIAQASHSLLKATKSSQAKAVAKNEKKKSHTIEKTQENIPIPVMQRSGTFILNEPTFQNIPGH